jgi:hypothetical protein
MPQEIALLRVGLNANQVRNIAAKLGAVPRTEIPSPAGQIARRPVPYKEWINNEAEALGLTPACLYKRIQRGFMQKPETFLDAKNRLCVLA